MLTGKSRTFVLLNYLFYQSHIANRCLIIAGASSIVDMLVSYRALKPQSERCA